MKGFGSRALYFSFMPAALLIMQAKDIDFMDDEATQTKKSDFRLLFFGSTVNTVSIRNLCGVRVYSTYVTYVRMYVERRMNGEKKDIHSFHRYCDLVITMHDVQMFSPINVVSFLCPINVAMEVLVACPPLVYWFPYLNLV